MPDVNLQLVREFFELRLFHILTNWRQKPWKQHTVEQGAQLFIDNTAPSAGDVSFILGSDDVVGIDCAMVEVRAWHTDRLYPSVIESNPILYQFASDASRGLATEVFSGRAFRCILVVSELPSSPDQRQRSIELLKAAGVDHTIEFAAILRGLLDAVDVNDNYSGSATLQTLRLLKRYEFIRRQQLEFMFHTEPPTPGRPPSVEATLPPEPEEEDEA